MPPSIVIKAQRIEQMARKYRKLINSPPPKHDTGINQDVPLGSLQRRGRPMVSIGETCRSALSFSLLKIHLKASWTDLELAYHDESSALFNAQSTDSGASFNADPKEQRTFLRYGSGHQTPSAGAQGRLTWAKKNSGSFAAMYDSVLFDFLDLAEEDEGARIQFACWLWRTTMLPQAGQLDTTLLLEERQAQLQKAFTGKMQAFLRAPRDYGRTSQPKPNLRRSLALLNGRRLDASVVANFSVTQKTAPSWVIPPPYQDVPQLHKLCDVEHPDALCILLFGVKHPGAQPGIRELALAGCEAWLTRWVHHHPDLVGGKGLKVFFDVLGTQVNELKPRLELLSVPRPATSL